MRDALAESKLQAMDEAITAMEAEAHPVTDDQQILQQISDQEKGRLEAIIELERKKLMESLSTPDPVVTAEDSDDDEAARIRRDEEELALLQQKFSMERDEKLKTLMRTSSVQFTTAALTDESPEAIQERNVGALVHTRFTVARRCRALEQRMAFKTLQGSFDRQRLAVSGQPHDGSYSAEMERLDNAEAVALEKLCQDLTVAEAKDEDAEDEESRRLMTEVATVDIKEETNKLMTATQTRLQKVEAQYEALKVASDTVTDIRSPDTFASILSLALSFTELHLSLSHPLHQHVLSSILAFLLTFLLSTHLPSFFSLLFRL